MRNIRSVFYIFPFVVIFFFGCTHFSNKKSPDEYVIGERFTQRLEAVNILLNKNQFDSAETLLLKLSKQTKTPLEKYLIYCYQAEIMYYNMLPELAYSNLDAAMKIAIESGKQELISNCENYNGLFKIIDKKPEEAKIHFYKAENLYRPSSELKFLVNDYQIYSNLAETHLMTNNPDSAIFYAKKGFGITEGKDIKRGSALNYWTMGKAYFQKGLIKESKGQYKKGLEKIEGNENGDVTHYIYAGLIECAIKENDKTAAIGYINKGKDSILNEKSSILGETDFYVQASAAAEYFGLTAVEIELEKKQLQIINESRENELVMQSKILSSYFEELNTVKQEEQQKQLTNRLIQSILLMVLLVLIFVIYLNRKLLRQKIRFNELESKSKMNILVKEKEMDAIIARNSAIEEERTRISKELHDDIGSSVSSIKIYNNLAQKQFEAEQPQKAKELLEKSGAEIKQIEESLGDLIWAVYTKNETIQNLIMRMKQYAFDVLAAKEIEAGFDYPYQLNDTKLPIEFRKNMLLIFKEFVNNTAKYSHAKHFSFSISVVSDNTISICLWDDGVGFDANVNTGKGLSNMKSRAKAMNAEFTLTSSLGNGTRLQIIYHFYS
jgi:signal transduction histidine kinase